MDPRELRSIVENAIRGMIDWETWNRCVIMERAQRDSMKDFAVSWKKAVAGEQIQTGSKIVPPAAQTGLWSWD
jgi:hypothetical protein